MIELLRNDYLLRGDVEGEGGSGAVHPKGVPVRRAVHFFRGLSRLAGVDAGPDAHGRVLSRTGCRSMRNNRICRAVPQD